MLNSILFWLLSSVAVLIEDVTRAPPMWLGIVCAMAYFSGGYFLFVWYKEMIQNSHLAWSSAQKWGFVMFSLPFIMINYIRARGWLQFLLFMVKAGMLYVLCVFIVLLVHQLIRSI